MLFIGPASERSERSGPLFFLHKGQFLQTGWQSPHIPPCKRAIFCEKCDQKLGYMFIPIKSASFLGDFHFSPKPVLPPCNLPHFWEISIFLQKWSQPHLFCLIFGRFLLFVIFSTKKCSNSIFATYTSLDSCVLSGNVLSTKKCSNSIFTKYTPHESCVF